MVIPPNWLQLISSDPLNLKGFFVAIPNGMELVMSFGMTSGLQNRTFNKTDSGAATHRYRFFCEVNSWQSSLKRS